MTDKEKIREDLERLQANINECLDDLAIARDRKDDGEELIALRRMESLLGDVKQTCTSVLNSLDEEPLSEELKVELNKYIKGHFTIDTEQLDRFGIEEKDYMYSMDKSDMIALVEHFTNWQKEQFEKNRLKHCNSITNEQAELEQGFIDQHLDKYQRIPTFLDAIEYGIKLMKEQLMNGAFEFTEKHNTACVLASECLRNHGWFSSRERDFNDLFRHLSCVDKLFEGKFSGKTKVIVIKEG